MAQRKRGKGSRRRSPAKPRAKAAAQPSAAAKRKKKPATGPKPKRQQTPSVMADDLPDLVQSEYRRLLTEGLTDKQAAKQLAQKWKKMLKTRPLQDEFWLALAGTQWQLGRLTPAVKRNALEIIDRVLKPKRASRTTQEDETALHRRKALTALRGILTSQQPPRREIRRSTAPSSDADPWPVGEVFAYKLLSGRYVLFHVVACLGDKTAGFWPVFALLDWIGSDPPKASEVQKLPLKADPHLPEESSIWMVSVLRRHPSDFAADRIDWLHVHRQPHVRQIDRGFAITYWKEKLDEKLRFDFGWE